MKRLLMKNSIKASENANCMTFEVDTEIGFPIKWSQRQHRKWHDFQCDTSIEPEDDDDCIVQLYINLDNIFITNNVLYYIAGFIVKKLVQIIKCQGCISNIIQKVSENEKTLTGFSILIDLKDNGGLVYASHDLFKIVCATEKEFSMIIGDDRTKIPKKGSYNDIVQRVTRKFLHNSVLPLNNRCFDDVEIGVQPPHRIQLISTICKKYLTLRMFSHSDKLSKQMIARSQRQRLTKLIQFRNN